LKEKHLPFFAILDALENNECPICFLTVKSIESYFNSLLYENITDIGFRSKFRKQNGFCNFHSYKFFKYNDSLAILLTYKDLLVQKINEYNKKNLIIKTKKNKHKECLICDLAKDIEQRYILEIIDHLNDIEFKNKFIKSEGLCIQHFEFVLSKLKKIPKWFFDFQISKYKTLMDQINKSLEASNFSKSKNRPVLSIEEAGAWKKIIKIISGFEGMQLK
jgi:hypothetical protein